MIKELLNNEKFVKKLEDIVKEIEIIKELKDKTDVSFVLPIIILALEQLRTSTTPFPKEFFNKTKNK